MSEATRKIMDATSMLACLRALDPPLVHIGKFLNLIERWDDYCNCGRSETGKEGIPGTFVDTQGQR